MAGTFAVFLGLMVLGREENRSETAPSTTVDPVISVARGTESRPVYRHSVVPGGVHSDREAQTAAHRERIVAAHYQGLNLTKLTPVALDHPVDRYVSFRRDGRIYWTSRRMRVPKGELLLTDGESLVRARCGNRLSETPQEPTTAWGAEEPTDAELSTVETLVTPVTPPGVDIASVQQATAAIPNSAIAPVGGSPATAAGLQDESQAIQPPATTPGGGFGPAMRALESLTATSTLTPPLPPPQVPRFDSTPAPTTDPTVTVAVLLPVPGTTVLPATSVFPTTTVAAPPTRPGSSRADGVTAASRPETPPPDVTIVPQTSIPSLIPGGTIPEPGPAALETPEAGTLGICALAVALGIARTRRKH